MKPFEAIGGFVKGLFTGKSETKSKIRALKRRKEEVERKRRQNSQKLKIEKLKVNIDFEKKNVEKCNENLPRVGW